MSLGDCIGKKFNRLIVLDEWYDKESKQTMCKCKCDCGNFVTTRKSSLKNNHAKSCGCHKIDRMKKENFYNLDGEYGIGYTAKGEEFYFDLEDYDKVKDYCWYISKSGYVCTNNLKKEKPKTIKIQNIIMGIDTSRLTEDKIVDHINRDTLNNRKENLRICSKKENCINKSKFKNNTSGIIGVYYKKEYKKWYSIIRNNGKQQQSPYFKNKEDAIIYRLNDEYKIYGKDFAPQRHLFKEYGIGDEE